MLLLESETRVWVAEKCEGETLEAMMLPFEVSKRFARDLGTIGRSGCPTERKAPAFIEGRCARVRADRFFPEEPQKLHASAGHPTAWAETRT